MCVMDPERFDADPDANFFYCCGSGRKKNQIKISQNFLFHLKQIIETHKMYRICFAHSTYLILQTYFLK